MPTYVHTLIGFTPPPRTDEPFTQARIEGRAGTSGAITAIETITLSPVDTDPLNPQPRTLTTDDAPFAEGYLRVVFIDAGGQESAPSELVPSPGPAAGALTTLDAVRRLLQKTESDTVQDPLLEDMILEASVMLGQELGRQFSPEIAATKTFAYFGRGWVNLAPYDLRTVTAATYDSDGDSPVVLASTGWRLRGQTSNGTYRDLNLVDYTNGRLGSSESQVVSITGNWGFAEVPVDVERGVKITVKTWLREGAAFTSDGDLIRFERVGRIPQDVLDGLAHYRLPLVY